MLDFKSWNGLLKNITYVLGIVLIYIIINYLSVYLLPFFLAIVAAYILNPFVKFFQFKIKLKNRVVSVLSVFTIISLILFALIYFIGPYVVAEIKSSGELISTYFIEKSQSADSLTNLFINQFNKIVNPKFLESLVNQSNIDKYAEDLLIIVWNFFMGVFGIFDSFFILITFTLYLLFILVYYDEFSNNWQRYIPPIYRKNAIMVFEDLEKSMKIYFRGQSKIVILLCIMFAVGFKIVGLPLAILLGVITGLANFIPYLQLVMIPPALLLMSIQAIENGTPFWQEALLVLAVFAVVQVIQDTILVPKIMGGETGLNPAIILLSLSIFGGLFGLIGMLIALPVSTVLIKYYQIYILKEVDVI